MKLAIHKADKARIVGIAARTRLPVSRVLRMVALDCAPPAIAALIAVEFAAVILRCGRRDTTVHLNITPRIARECRARAKNGHHLSIAALVRDRLRLHAPASMVERAAKTNRERKRQRVLTEEVLTRYRRELIAEKRLTDSSVPLKLSLQ